MRFLLGVAVGAALAYGASTFLAGRPLASPEAAPQTRPPAAPEALPAGVRGQIDAADRALAQAKQSGKAVPVTLVFSERDLTATASAYFPQTFAGATLSDPQVRLVPGRIELTTAATASILRTTAAVVATPIVVNGRPAARIESATIGGAPLPDRLREIIAGQLAEAIGAGLPAKLTVSAITVVAGTMTVEGIAAP